MFFYILWAYRKVKEKSEGNNCVENQIFYGQIL